MNRRLVSRIALLGLLGSLAGCVTQPPIKVEPGFRDYAVITYHPAPDPELPEEGDDTVDMPMLTRVELIGAGYLKYYRGRSSRMRDAYWRDTDDHDWSSYYTDQVVVDQEEVRVVLQGLADAGLFDRGRQGDRRDNPAGPFVTIHSRVGKRQGFVISDQPEVMQVYTYLARHFAHR